MKQKLISILITLSIIMTFTACSGKSIESNSLPQTRIFTDSIGRKLEIPVNIEKIAVSGTFAQIVCFALCPDKLVGIATPWDDSAKDFFEDKYYNMPVTGQIYGGTQAINLEELINSGAQIIIDIGETKASIKDELDALQKQLGIPVVHISAYTASMDETYIMLGDLLNMEKDAAVIADYCRKTYERAVKIANSVEKKNLLYILMDGQNVIAKGSYHAEIIDMFSNNIAELNNISSKGTGNEVDMEQILSWNPEYILFAPDSIYDDVANDPIWQDILAIKTGNYFKVPSGPYNWMGFPPSVQRFSGMIWLPYILYPESCDYDLFEEIKEYYKIFYHCDLTEQQFLELTGSNR